MPGAAPEPGCRQRAKLLMLHIYVREPVDDWRGWLAEAQYRAGIADDPFATRNYEALRQRAFDLARSAGWDGYMIHGPYVSGLPAEGPVDDGLVMLGWQQRDGLAFIVSPYPLPWLREWASSSPMRVTRTARSRTGKPGVTLRRGRSSG